MPFLEAHPTIYFKVPVFNNPETKLSKAWLESEKMLVTNIFSFSHNVFYHFKDSNHRFDLHLTCCLEMLRIETSKKISC